MKKVAQKSSSRGLNEPQFWQFHEITSRWNLITYRVEGSIAFSIANKQYTTWLDNKAQT